jgi:hypothetical protein
MWPWLSGMKMRWKEIQDLLHTLAGGQVRFDARLQPLSSVSKKNGKAIFYAQQKLKPRTGPAKLKDGLALGLRPA